MTFTTIPRPVTITTPQQHNNNNKVSLKIYRIEFYLPHLYPILTVTKIRTTTEIIITTTTTTIKQHKNDGGLTS